jgi:subtilisin family serine protease
MLSTILALSLVAGPPVEIEHARDNYGNLRPCRKGTVILGLAPESPERAAVVAKEKDPSKAKEYRSRLSALGGTWTKDCPQLGIIRLELHEGDDIPSACRRFAELSGARFVEPEWMGEGGYTPDDTYYIRQWHHPRIEMPSAWDTTRGSTSIVIAVLDTGIDPDHPDFVGRVVAGYDFVNEDSDPMFDDTHGLSTSGLAAANGGDGFGVAGIDHRAKIMPVKVLDEHNQGTSLDLVDGIVYAANHGAHVLNMSLINFPESDSLKDAIGYARGKGAVLVACAGNRGPGDADQSWPGASPLCITVGATNRDDVRASYSGTGQALDIVAPGDNVETVSLDGSDGTSTFSGCSAATPVAAGIAALILSVDPSLTADDVQSLLQEGADDRVGDDTTTGWDSAHGWGRVNARRSLSLIGKKEFRRGDTNGDGIIDISDAVFGLVILFVQDAPLPPCGKAADANDDGLINISDPIELLSFLFKAGSLSPPHKVCGIDPTPDTLECPTTCR